VIVSVRNNIKYLSKFKPFIGDDKWKLILIVISNIFLSLIDVIAIAIIGVLTSLTVNGIQSNSPQKFARNFLNLFHLSSLNFQRQVAILGTLAALLLIFRTLASAFLLRNVMRFLVNKTLEITKMMVKNLLNQEYLDLQRRSLQKNTFLISDSIRNISLGIIGTTINLCSDIILTLAVIVALFVVDPFSTIILLLLFLGILYPIQRNMNKRATKLGNDFKFLTLRLRSKIIEAISAFRELHVKDRRQFYIDEIISNQQLISRNAADAAFMPYVSKYTLDILVVLVAVALAGYQFASHSAIQAITILSIFLTASSRLTPAMLRIQQAVLILKINLATSKETIELIDEFEIKGNKSQIRQKVKNRNSDKFIPQIVCKKLDYMYPDSNRSILKNVSFTIDENSIFGVTGSSGVGKTTLVDLLLGILEPNDGSIEISGLNPKRAIESFAGKIAYVPQQILIVDGSLRENLTLGYDNNFFSDYQLIEALERASLSTFYYGLESGLDTHLNDLGSNISGGQRQRLGIARALITSPQILVFDEATSSLDVNTEGEILRTIQNLKKGMTIVMIAHRLSTLKICNKIIFLSENEYHVGTLNSIRRKSTEFNQMLITSGL
jgi:ATP-binding cassette subfamily C protein